MAHLELMTLDQATIAAWVKNQRLQECSGYSETTHGKWVVCDGYVKNTLTGELAYKVGEFPGEMVYYFVDRVVVSPEYLRANPMGAKSTTYSELVVYCFPDWVKDAKINDSHVGNIYDKMDLVKGNTPMPSNTVAYIPVFRDATEIVKEGMVVSEEKPTTYWTSGIATLAVNDKEAEVYARHAS